MTESTRDLLLGVAFRHRIDEPTIEAGYECFVALTNSTMDIATFAEAVGSGVRDRLFREPVRLSEGALQCRWQLELTATGVAAAKRLSP